MKTWNDYKNHVNTVDPEISKDLKETEEFAAIVSAMIEQRNALGLSQRDLATMCGLPQSSVARIESCKTTPNLRTLLKTRRRSLLRIDERSRSRVQSKRNGSVNRIRHKERRNCNL